MNVNILPDDFKEKSAFNKLIYQKTWKVRGFKDPLQTLQAYQAKIRNSMNNYIKEKGAVKWNIWIKYLCKRNLQQIENCS